jgi:hypothetical protein
MLHCPHGSHQLPGTEGFACSASNSAQHPSLHSPCPSCCAEASNPAGACTDTATDLISMMATARDCHHILPHAHNMVRAACWHAKKSSASTEPAFWRDKVRAGWVPCTSGALLIASSAPAATPCRFSTSHRRWPLNSRQVERWREGLFHGLSGAPSSCQSRPLLQAHHICKRKVIERGLQQT